MRRQAWEPGLGRVGSLQSRMASLVLGRLHAEGGDEQEVRANSIFPHTKAAAGTTSISTKLPHEPTSWSGWTHAVGRGGTGHRMGGW